jgi:hypothetical protein
MEKRIILESAKGVKNNKVQLCFSQIVESSKTNTNVLGLLNASDERFTQSKPRYAWVTAEPKDVKAQFGIDVDNLKQGEVLEIGAVDPRMASFPETALNIQITETTEGSDYDVQNFETRAKRAGKDGDFIMKDGLYIYVNTTVVPGEPKHAIITDTERVSANGSSLANSLGV